MLAISDSFWDFMTPAKNPCRRTDARPYDDSRGVPIRSPFLNSPFLRLACRLGGNHLKRFVSRRQCAVDVLGRVHRGNKGSLKLRWRQEDSPIEQLAKKLGVSPGVG